MFPACNYKCPPPRDLTPHRSGNRAKCQPDFVLNSKSDLIILLRRNSPQGGLPVKKLRESWAGVTNAIEELEREGRVLVTRTGKNPHSGGGGGGGGGAGDGQMKMVFLDDIGRDRDPLDQGQSITLFLAALPGLSGKDAPFSGERLTPKHAPSLAEFKDLWHSLKTPIGDELAQELQAGASSGARSNHAPFP